MSEKLAEQAEPYDTAAPNAYEWTERAFDLLQSGDLAASIETKAGIHTALVTGQCPRCRHAMTFQLVLDTVTGESLGTLSVRKTTYARQEYVALTVSCQCTEPHAGRPGNIDHGCGINFRIDMRAGA
jgi:hypothetical protein